MVFILEKSTGRDENSKDLDDLDLSARKILPQSEPEDFYPVAEFSRNSAILLGCHNHIRLMPKLYGDIAKAINGKVPLFGIVSDESQAKAGNELIKRSWIKTGINAIYYKSGGFDLDSGLCTICT